jgi:hypothetical protein
MAKSTQKDSIGAEGYTNKVFQVLLCLDEATRKGLSKYLRSPYFVQSKTLFALCEALSKEIEQGHTDFDRKKIWGKLFPGAMYDDVNFRKHCSDLLKHTHDFMAFESLKLNMPLKSVEALNFIADKKIEVLYKNALQQARENVAGLPYRTAEHFLLNLLVEQQYFSLMEFDMKAEVRTNLEDISNNLDMYYWIEKLKICCSVLSHQKTSNQRYQIHFVQEIKKFVEEQPLEVLPELAIYYYSFMTLYEQENIQHYAKLKHLLEGHMLKMPQKEAIELIDSTLNYCASQINKGNRDFLQEYFDLFEDAMKKGIFLQDGTLATLRFNNILASALGLGKYDWAEAFIERYKHFLPPDSRENTYTFNLARVYRFQKKHQKVIELLQNVEYEDIHYNLISRMMLLITYFELQEFETLLSFTESFKIFLTRHKNIPPQRRQGYLNLIKYTRRLMRLNQHDKAAVAKLHNEVSLGKANIINHEWLLEKLR